MAEETGTFPLALDSEVGADAATRWPVAAVLIGTSILILCCICGAGITVGSIVS